MKNPPTNISGYDPTRDAEGFSWDSKAAQKVVDFFAECLMLTTDSAGAQAGQPFVLQPWQRDFVATLYGWKRPNGKRRYREASLFVPRKNGKTELGAGLALYGLCCDGEAKAEVYSAALSREQASRVFEPASIMVRNSAELSARLRIIDSSKRIVFNQRNSYYVALAAESATAHGKNPHLILFDELHTQRNRKLYDGLKTGQGSRRQPLIVDFSTAGYDRHSICWEVWNYARQVRDGIIKDTTFLPCIYEITEEEDWKEEKVWQRCNPSLGVTVGWDSLREEFARALASPAYENTFRNLYLNEWTEQSVRWISMESWDKCLSDTVDLSPTSRFFGQECYAALDLSATTDLSALALVFPMEDGRVLVKVFFWVPEESAGDRERRDRVPYRQWIDAGLITATPGRSVDYDRIRADISELSEQYNIQTIAIDRWNANQLAKQLEDDGFKVGFFGQGYASMSSPAKEFERLVVDADLIHDGNPVLRWMANNVAVERDAAGNIKPSKDKSTERIDGIVAIVMALGVMNIQVQWAEDEIGL